MIKIINGNVFSKNGFENKTIYITNDKIVENNNSNNIIDASSCYVVPGFVDGHTHGRCGIDILKTDIIGLENLSEAYLKTGVTSVFPTIMTAPLDSINKTISYIKNANTSKGAEFVGIHIEGPYISPKKPGCHDVSLIRKPDYDEMYEMTMNISPLKARFTIAPEECDNNLIKNLSKIANLSIGHTNCSSKQAFDALNDGATSFTHTFNAMSSLTHRNSGCASAALASENYAEFICDGLHVDYDVIKLSYKAKTKYTNKFALITDSIPSAGLEDGDYDMNGIKFHLDKNGAKTSTGTLVGSTISMLDAVKNLVNYCDVDLYSAIESATKVPCEMLKLDDRGTLDIGQKADVLVLNKDLEIIHVIKHGEIII